MKHIYLVGGTMGIGKTTVCQILKSKLPNSVFLDGDWCWDMHPFLVTEETKRMVMENICFLLNNFIRCSAYENILFGWVMHRQEIIDEILAHLNTAGCEIFTVSLVCSDEALKERLQADIDAGVRRDDGVLARSLPRIPLYAALQTVKIDTTFLSAEQVAEQILCLRQ